MLIALTHTPFASLLAHSETKHLISIHNGPNARVFHQGNSHVNVLFTFVISWFKITQLAGCTLHHGNERVHGQSLLKAWAHCLHWRQTSAMFLKSKCTSDFKIKNNQQYHKNYCWTCSLAVQLLGIKVNEGDWAVGLDLSDVMIESAAAKLAGCQLSSDCSSASANVLIWQ